MNREDLIKKIAALRALSSSSNLNEAAAAARAAEKLIQDHAIEEAEFEFTNGSQEQVHQDDIPIMEWGQRQTVWQSSLINCLAKAYGCAGILSHKNGKIGFYSIGRPADISIVRYQYAFFHLEMTRLAQLLAPDNLTRGEGKQWYNSFYLGAVRSIRDSLVASKKEVQTQASSQAMTIINQHAIEVDNLFRKLYPHTRSVNSKSSINSDAYSMGKQAGAGINSKPGLNSGFRGLLSR
jgi:hypothetical protein